MVNSISTNIEEQRDKEERLEQCKGNKERQDHLEQCKGNKEKQDHLEQCKGNKEKQDHLEQCKGNKERKKITWNRVKETKRERRSLGTM